jgi:hypothetical protein
MRPTYLLFLFIPFLSCFKDREIILFEIPMIPIDFTLQAGLNPLDTYYFDFEVPSNFEGLLQTFNRERADVQAILPLRARLVSRFGEGSYDMLFQEITLQICEPDDDQPRCGFESFYWDFWDLRVGQFVNLVPNEPNLVDIVSQETFKVQLRIRLRQTPVQSLDTRLEFSFKAE